MHCTEADEVFVKDMAYYLVNRLDNPALLPKDYIHTFILRNPKKSVYSLYKMSLNKELTGKYNNYDYILGEPKSCKLIVALDRNYGQGEYI